MKRGFLSSSSSTKTITKTVKAPLSPSRAPNAPGIIKSDADAASSRRVLEDDAIIKVDKDYTCIWQDVGGLILQSDYRFDEKVPYIGYFPPSSTEPEMCYIDDDVSKIEEAMSWTVWKTPQSAAAAETAASPCFTIQAVKGKGLAMIASRPIPTGTLIVAERPFYVSIQSKQIAPDMGMSAQKGGGFHRCAASRLGKKARKALLSLSNCYGDDMDEIPGKLGTNYLPVDVQPRADEQKNYCGAFATLSRANHSCAPNANYFFKFSDYTGRFYAVRDIAKGDEITVMYTDTLAPSYDRRDSLLHSHRFICMCPFCTLPEARQDESDSNRIYLKGIRDTLHASPPVILPVDELRKAIRLAEKESIWVYVAQFWYLGACNLFMQGQKEHMLREAIKWFEKARELYIGCEGRDEYHVTDIEKVLG